MRSLSTAVLSLTAMALSSLTTYLTFFDARYTLTTAVSSVQMQVQRGSSSSGDVRRIYIRTFAHPSIILSNRGTRPLVLTDVTLAPSESLDQCVLGDAEPAYRLGQDVRAAVIVEPDTVQELAMEFSLEPSVDAVEGSNGFGLEDTTTLWCLKWTVFDHTGRRREPLTEAFTLSTRYVVPEDEDYPSAELDIDYPKQPQRLVSRGFF